MKLLCYFITFSLLLQLCIFAGCGGKLVLREFCGSSVEQCWLAPRANSQNTGFINGKLSRSPKIIWTSSIGALDPTAPVISGGYVMLGTAIKRIVAIDAETGKINERLWVDTPLLFPPVINNMHLAFLGFGSWNRIGIYNLTEGEMVWSRRAGDAHLAPVISDSVILFATLSGGVYALSLRDGKKLWQRKLQEPVRTLISARNDTFWLTAGKDIYAFGIDGSIFWHIKLSGVPSGALTVSGNSLLVSLLRGEIVALAADKSKMLWNFTTDSQGGLPVATDGKNVIVTDRTGKIYALSIDDGSLIWQVALNAPVIAPAIVVGKTVIVATYIGKISCINVDTGEISSVIDCASPVRASPASDGKKIFIPAQNGKIFCLQ